MFVGPASTGKTQLVKGKLASEGNMSLNINFNYFTVSSHSRRSLSPSWREGGCQLRAPGTTNSSTLLMISTCQSWTHDTTMPISHIRQHLGWGHWFDRAKLSEVIHNTVSWRADLRCFRHQPAAQRLFMTLAVDFPGQDSLMKIYGTFLNGHLKHFNADCQELGMKLIQASLANHEKVVQSFRLPSTSCLEFRLATSRRVPGSPLLHP